MPDTKTCQLHPSKTIQFICMDQQCKSTPSACILCVKNSHSKCGDAFIIGVEEQDKQIKVNNSTIDLQSLTNKLGSLIDLKAYEMEKQLMVCKKQFIQSFEVKELVLGDLTDKFILNVKKNHKITFNKETEQIEVSSKFNCEEEEIQDSLIYFENNLESKIQRFLEEFQSLQFWVVGQFNSSEWVSNEAVEINDSASGLDFSRKSTNQAFDYFASIYQQPLAKDSRFRITVHSVYSNDRFVDVGIIDEEKYQQTLQTLKNPYSSGGISYCGYSIQGGLSGDYPTQSASSEDGLKPGSIFYMDYKPGNSIKYTNDDNTVNLSLSLEGNTKTYYLYCLMYHPQTKFTIEKLQQYMNYKYFIF